MITFSGAFPRPIRLKEETRLFAYESLHGKYGDEAKNTLSVSLDHIPSLDKQSPSKQCALAMLEVAKRAPLRICPHESVSGAATLGGAFLSGGLANYNGKNLLPGTDHLTLGFIDAVNLGINAYEKKIQQRKANPNLTAHQIEVLDTLQSSIDALHIYHQRYMDELSLKKPENAENLKNVPFLPPTSFKKAVQSLWFLFSFARLLGNWPGIGRIDVLLGPYLKEDLKKGIITLEEAREFLAGFFIKGCEWIESDPTRGSGDAQTYQNIVLGGLHCENGILKEVSNEVTYLILEIIEELPIGDFPITVRMRKDSPERLKELTARAIRCGGGTVAVYNEELIFDSMVRFGYPEKEIVDFANDGCWEVQIPGKTCFSYYPFDGLRILLNDTLRLHTGAPAHFDDYDSLYDCFLRNLENTVLRIKQSTLDRSITKDEEGNEDFINSAPCAFVSLLTDDCIEKARYYHEGGARYTILSPHIGGVPDIGNSLYAIDKLVFKDKLMGFDDLMRALKNNWANEEYIRQYALNKYTYFGNDNDEADAYVTRLLDDYGKMLAPNGKDQLILFPAGASTFGRQINWAPYRVAVPFGKKAGEILSGNLSPTPNTDVEGASAVIRSYCKSDLAALTTGCALDLKLDPGAIEHSKGIEVLCALIDGFVELGGYFMQVDVVSAETLRDAQAHPENYKNLSVRVSGWNARFVSLDEQWQRMIIERTEQRK
ncbi:MAG: hypothetical protein IJX08_04655 [Clostridia bacterium]|nr:hypothetical protein [Clostridia bacterium]